MLKKKNTRAAAVVLEARVLLESTDCPLEDKLRVVQAVREESAQAASHLDRFLVGEVTRLRDGLRVATEQQDKLREVLDTFTSSPWLPGILIDLAETPRGRRAIVSVGGSFRIVPLDDRLDPSTLDPGDEVLLSKDSGILAAKSTCPALSCGETAAVARMLPDDRLVIRWREEEVVVRVAAPLRRIALVSGDLVRWDRGAWMAFEKVEHDDGAHLFLEETPRESFDAIGGLDTQIEALRRCLRLHSLHPELARRYRLRQKRSVLLAGPPGTGKTMMARALAAWIADLSASGRSRFMNIKPAALHSEWFGRSEANYREAFRVARQASAECPEVPVVMFFDEVDAIGGPRGSSHMHVDDRVLTAFMAELDGLEDRGNIFVVAATNRRDAIDPALLRPGRLGDTVLTIGRPRMQAAREIFGKHLSVDVPYRSHSGVDTGDAADAMLLREEAIEAVVSRIYAPNGDNTLATVTLRDGSQRDIRAADLVSGASIAKMVANATECACYRELETGDSGVCLKDLLDAADNELQTAMGGLTPANCRAHLDGLPSDVDVMRIDPVERRVSRTHRYLEVA